MMRFFMTAAAIAMAVATAPRAGAAPGPKPVAPQRVLFVGNGFTSTNNLPSMVTLMVASRKQTLQTEMLAVPAATLGVHAANPAVAKNITSASVHWDHVVLQDRSDIPVQTPTVTLVEGNKLCDIVKKVGAKPVFFLTWAYRGKGDGKGAGVPAGMDEEMQNTLNLAYCAVAKANDARLAPVGPAWQAVLAKDPKAPLYAADGQQPSQDGSYLAACVFYALFTGQSPVGLPAKIAEQKGAKRRVLADVTSTRAKLYQQTAWDTVQNVTLETLLAEDAKKDAASPTVEEAKARLKKGMTINDAAKALDAQPVQRNDADGVYAFRLRNHTRLWLNCGKGGVITSYSAGPENGLRGIEVGLK